MFDAIKRLFGSGYIYSEFVTEDGRRGRARAPYIGDKDTLDEEEYTRNLKKEIWFKHGVRVTQVTISIH